MYLDIRFLDADSRANYGSQTQYHGTQQAEDVSEDVCASLTDRAEAHAASTGISTVVRFKLTSISLLFSPL